MHKKLVHTAVVSNHDIIFFKLALSCTKLTGNTCINKDDRQGIQLSSIKSVPLQIGL